MATAAALPPIASLGMYDWPEIAPATDRFWAAIRDRLRADAIVAPDHLTRGADAHLPAWTSPALLLSQTCGMPYRTMLHDRVALVGTPDYGLPDADPGYYYSQLVLRADDPGGFADHLTQRLAYNEAGSQSGWAAPQTHAAAAGGRFHATIATGSHRESARAVAEGRADIAAIDAVTWRLIGAHRPALAASLRVLGHTAPTPGLPLITSPQHDALRIANAVAGAIADLAASDRDDLGLRDLIAIPAAAYLAIPTPPPPRS